MIGNFNVMIENYKVMIGYFNVMIENDKLIEENKR